MEDEVVLSVPKNSQSPRSPRSKVRVALEAFIVSAAAGAASGAAVAAFVYWLTEPNCAGSQDFLCGLGQVLIAFAVGALVGVAAMGTTAWKMVAHSLPPGERALPMFGALVALPMALSVLLALDRVLSSLFGL